MDRTKKHWSCRVVAALALALPGPSASLNAQQATSAPVVISLQEAIHRAQQNEPVFAGAVAAQRSAGIDRYLSQAALLPGVTYHNQVLYTEPNGQTNGAGQIGSQPSPIFIANNAVREYASQASINEKIGMQQIADAHVASANAARASAELEVARRGLVASVVSLYYSVAAADTRKQLLIHALDEATAFTELTQKREKAREVAHADVIKAQLQQQQRQIDLSDANVKAANARIELAVLLFPDPRTPYTTNAPDTGSVLPAQDAVNQAAAINSPELRSALAGLKASNAEVTSAKAAYLPDLALNFSYGIDAPQFAKHGPDDARNLGYSMSATLDFPVWDWLSTQKRVKQSEIRRDVARVSVTAAQRRLIANLEQTYAEAAAARDQMGLLVETVRTADENLRLTKLRYSAGESTALEVVDAQNAFLSAQIAEADGTVRYQSALAAVQLLSGSL